MTRSLLKTIENKMSTFSKGQKMIAKYVLENYDKAAYMTASKLGTEVNVSESTVVRFADELTSFQRIEVTNTRMGDGDILTKVLMSDADRIKDTLMDIDKDAFYAAVDKIIGAKNIYILAARSSSYLAGFLNYNLRMVFDNVRLVQSTSGGEIFEQIINIGENDVIIAISFPRYSKRIVKAVNFAKNAGADVISITDSPLSPIAEGANQVLAVKSDMVSFVDSLVAPMSIINAIVAAVARKQQNELTERLRQLETIWDEYEVYDKNQG